MQLLPLEFNSQATNTRSERSADRQWRAHVGAQGFVLNHPDAGRPIKPYTFEVDPSDRDLEPTLEELVNDPQAVRIKALVAEHHRQIRVHREAPRLEQKATQRAFTKHVMLPYLLAALVITLISASALGNSFAAVLS